MNTTQASDAEPIDFDYWSELARSDLSTFERMRQEAIEELIGRSPERQQQRLRRLQWRIDRERQLSGSAMGACIRISRMMWDRMVGPGGLTEQLNQLKETLHSGSHPSYGTAEILVMPRREK